MEVVEEALAPSVLAAVAQPSSDDTAAVAASSAIAVQPDSSIKARPLRDGAIGNLVDKVVMRREAAVPASSSAIAQGDSDAYIAALEVAKADARRMGLV